MHNIRKRVMQVVAHELGTTKIHAMLVTNMSRSFVHLMYQSSRSTHVEPIAGEAPQ
jgi:hypothetical protein